MAIRTLLGAGLTALMLAGSAFAQGGYSDDMDQRLARIEQQLRDLQDQMYQGGGGGGPASGGGGGGDIQRLNDLEQSVRGLTGQVETFGHDLQTIKDKLNQLETETNFRLNQLEGNGGGKPPGGGPEVAPPPAGGKSPEPGAGPGPKTPGAIGEAPDAPPGSNAEGLYNAAMDHLTKAEYDDALTGFQQVVKSYATTDYAAQAQYWIGDIYYVRKDWEKAALAFAAVLKTYPQAGRGPESMLKLGLSLLSLNKKDQGCGALKAIKQKYPSASDAILSRAEREATKAGCK